jgi:hypothetical protein
LISKFGCDSQIIVGIEELAELQKELTKQLRGNGNINHIVSEIADVEIMIEQLKIIFNCKKEVENTKYYKIYRTKKRYLSNESEE